MAKDIELKLRLAMVEKVTGVLSRVNAGSIETAKGLKEARERLKQLQSTQADVASFRKLHENMRTTRAEADEAQRNVRKLAQQLAQTAEPTKALTRDFERAKREAAALSTKLTDQAQKAQKLRDGLTAAGLSASNLSRDEKALRGNIASTTAEIERRAEALNRNGTAQRRMAEMRERHRKAMAGTGAIAGAGAASLATGYALGRPLVSTMQAYAAQENSSTQLQASMMRTDGSVSAEFAKLDALAKSLGDKLPGTTAEFQEMMTMLVRQGMQAQTILGGLGEAAAYLGVQLRMPVTEAAEFAAKMQDATRTTEADMMGLMDMIQRTYYLGVDSGNMLQGFTKLSPVLPLLRKEGLAASQALAPLLVMMDQTGMRGDSAGNAIRKVFQAGVDEKKIGDANAALKKMKAGFALDFTDGNGKHGGIDAVFAQLDKIKTIDNDLKRTTVIKQMFGDDAETLQVVNTMMAKGKAGYEEVLAKMQAQADLKQRVDKQLATLTNVMDAAQGVGMNLLASIGETVAPQLKTLVEWLGRVGARVSAWVTQNPRLVATLVTIAAIVAAVATVFGALAIALAGLVGPILVARFLVARLAMMLVPLAGPILGALVAGLKLAASAIMLVGRALLMNPIGLVITAIAVAAFLIYKYWGPITGFFSTLWDTVKAKFVAFWQFAQASPVAALASISATIVNWSPLGLFYRALAGVLSYFGIELPAKFTEFGSNIMSGLVSGITAKFGAVRDAIGGAADSAIAKFREKLGIHSPSRVFMEAGGFITQGAALGIDRSLPMLRAAALGLAGATAVGMPAMAGALPLAPTSFDTRPPLAAASAGRAGGGGIVVHGDTITIHITAAPGGDAQALARAIRAELDKREADKRARVRGAFFDYDN